MRDARRVRSRTLASAAARVFASAFCVTQAAVGPEPSIDPEPEARSGPLQRDMMWPCQWLRLDHVQLAMPAGCNEQAIAFYEGILGIKHVPKPPHLSQRGGCWFEILFTGW